jgi:hypothetical protein
MDEGRLAGPVRTDYGVQFPWLNCQVDVVGDDEGAIGLAQTAQIEQWLSHGGASGLGP